MANVNQPNAAANRAADALLRQAGGRSVWLRVPSPATPGDPTEQLGLATPASQDVELAPVVFRRARATLAAEKGPRWELLISATAVHTVVGSLAFESARVLFEQSSGVLVDETLMEIEAVTESQIFGSPYVYRLLVRAPLALLT
jgi:hypothetical protein